MILLFNSANQRRRLPFSGRILQVWTTNRKQPKQPSHKATENQKDIKGSLGEPNESR